MLSACVQDGDRMAAFGMAGVQQGFMLSTQSSSLAYASPPASGPLYAPEAAGRQGGEVVTTLSKREQLQALQAQVRAYSQLLKYVRIRKRNV